MAHKRIAIFCDGTWARSDASEPTNVMRLARAVKRIASDGVAQQVIYVAGVGSGRGSNVFTRTVDRVTGGVFGSGLSGNIEEAFWHLAFNYEPGDQIYIFGYSRGAFTARSLAGLIRSSGIPTEATIHRIPEAMKWYRARGEDGHPDAEGPKAFRAEFSPLVATSQKDLEERPDAHPLQIAYLGVWDTVGSLGVPNQLFFSRYVNWRYRFHDQKLSRLVGSARHAVAVDERRRNFEPTLWDNLDDLNGNGAKDYEQSWFQGVHGAIGGGGTIRAISDITLGWIAEGAIHADLEVNATVLKDMTSEADVLGPLEASDTEPGLGTKFMRIWSRDRESPESAGHLSPEVIQRMTQDPGYRPKTLKPYFP